MHEVLDARIERNRGHHFPDHAAVGLLDALMQPKARSVSAGRRGVRALIRHGNQDIAAWAERSDCGKTPLPQRAAKLKGSLMILHNYEDDNVLFQNSLQMIDALERAGKQFELVLYTQKTHGVTGAEGQHVNASMLGFFERSLR